MITVVSSGNRCIVANRSRQGIAEGMGQAFEAEEYRKHLSQFVQTRHLCIDRTTNIRYSISCSDSFDTNSIIMDVDIIIIGGADFLKINETMARQLEHIE